MHLSGSRVLVALVTSLAAWGCGGAGFPAPVALGPSPDPAPQWSLINFAASSFEEGTDADDRKDLQALADAASEVAHSSLFQQTLAELPELDTGRVEDSKAVTTTGEHAASVFFGFATEEGPVRQPIDYRVAGNPWFGSETASTALDGAQARVKIHEVVLARYRKKTPESVACAVNTMVHEWTHAVALDPSSDTWAYQDSGHAHGTMPLVSYTFGATAQCSYLQQHGYSFSMGRCLAAVGTRSFHQNTCAAGWARKLEQADSSQ